jgi:hypothetical protein
MDKKDEKLEVLTLFRNEVMGKFLALCDYNDYRKISLLTIGDTIDKIFDRHVSQILKEGDE